MKRSFSALLLCLAAMAVSALDLGLGLGGRLGSTTTSETTTIMTTWTKDVITDKSAALRLQAVAGFKYAQFELGYFSAVDQGGKTVTTDSWSSSSSTTTRTADSSSHSFIALAAFLKYPFRLGGLVVSPMAGAEYDACVGTKDGSGALVDPSTIKNDAGDTVGNAYYSKFVAKLGLVLDLKLGPRLVLRPWVKGGFGFLSPCDVDVKNAYSAYSLTDFSLDAGAGLVFKL